MGGDEEKARTAEVDVEVEERGPAHCIVPVGGKGSYHHPFDHHFLLSISFLVSVGATSCACSFIIPSIDQTTT